MKHLTIVLAVGVLLTGCASTPKMPDRTVVTGSVGKETAALRDHVGAVAGAWENLGRYGAVKERVSAIGLSSHMHTEMIDWFTFQRNIVVELPGATSDLVYIVAHYDKTDCNPLAVASLMLNGSLDILTAPFTFSRGAKDNATGVAVALELANTLARRTNHYTYRILFTGSEESGLRGSRAHVARLSAADCGRIVLAVNIDTVGIAGVSNCVTRLADDEDMLANAAVNVAHDLGMPLDSKELPFGVYSDFVPFQKTSWWRDMLLGVAFNLAGGFLPQRSWFTSYTCVPVIDFGSPDVLDIGDDIGGAVFLPFGALHGPRDTANGIDLVRLHEQYAIVREILARVEAGTIDPRSAAK